jgi:hypothetical protein
MVFTFAATPSTGTRSRALITSIGVGVVSRLQDDTDSVRTGKTRMMRRKNIYMKMRLRRSSLQEEVGTLAKPVGMRSCYFPPPTVLMPMCHSFYGERFRQLPRMWYRQLLQDGQ